MSFLLVALIGSAAEVTDVFAFNAVNDLKNSQDWTASKSLNMPTFNYDYKGVQIGVKNTPAGEFTLTSTKSYANVKTVNITASTGGACSISVSVGDAVFTSNGQNSVAVASGISNAGKVYSFAGDGNGYVVVTFNATSKAMYLGQIEVIYDDGAAETDVKTPTFSLKEDTYYEAQQVIIATETEGASITYSVTKNDVEFVASTTAVAPVTVELPMETVAASYVITAKAVKDGMTESAEVSATYTLNPNKPAEKLFYMASLVIDIKAGDEVVFVSPEKLAAMTETPDGDRIGSVVATIQDGVNNPYNGETYLHKLDLNQNPEAGVYIVGVDGGNYTFQSKIGGQYLSAPTKDNDNDLYLVNEAATDFEKWTLKEVKGGLVAYSLAQPARLIQKNNDARYGFATYKGSQSNAYIFKYVADLSGVESNVAEEAAVINTIAGGVVVAVSEPATAAVYTVSGQLVANQAVDATATINLANGFYIVKVGNTVKKVIVR